MKRLKIGDIFEIPLSNGKKSFGQYVYREKQNAPLIRVFDHILKEGNEINIQEISSKPLLFPTVITGLYAAIREGIWRVIGNTPIEGFEYPLFVSTFWDQKTGEAGIWFLWDGEKETRLGKELPDEYKKLEFLIGWGPPHIVQRIEKCGETLFPYKGLLEHNQYKPKE